MKILKILALSLLLAVSSIAYVDAAARFPFSGLQLDTTSGKPLGGGKINFWANGTTTDKNTWKEVGLSNLNANPVILDANGVVPEVWAADADVFSFRITDSSDVVILATVDDISFLAAFSLTAADVLAALNGNSAAVVIDGSTMGGNSYASFITALTLTAAGSIDTSLGAFTSATQTVTDDVSFSSAKGLDMSANANGTGTVVSEKFLFANRGSFTAYITDDSGDNTATHTTSAGFYARLDSIVFFSGVIRLSDKTGLTAGQQARIAGFPFTSENTANKVGGLVVTSGQGFAITATASVTGTIDPNSTEADLGEWNATTGVSTLLISEIVTGADIIFFGFYFT